MQPWGAMEGVRPSKQLHRLLDAGKNYSEAFAFMQRHYGISQEKFALLWQVCQVERPFLLESSHPHLFSVYVGIPFCPTRCLYCSFPSHPLTELNKFREKFVEKLLFEIKATGQMTQHLQMTPYTVYLGGGTPTSLEPEELAAVIDALKEAFPGTWREFTVEAGRPDTITPAHVKIFKSKDVTRTSVNPQSMHAETLKTIGRRHSVEEIQQAVKYVREAKIPVLNMDLILGLPGENAGMIAASVKQLLNFAPENITLHIFSPKRASRYYQNQSSYLLPPDEEIVEMQKQALALLTPHYRPYYLYRQRNILAGLENIGLCTPGHECIYNIVMIEERHHILGLGGGATSKIINQDFTLTNLFSPKDVRIYLQRVEALLERREKALLKALQNV